MPIGMQSVSVFGDRVDAGRRLAMRLCATVAGDPVVVGIPRGGVLVAAEVARHLDAVLDILVVRKVHLPHPRDLAVGAVTSDGCRFLYDDLVHLLDVSAEYIDSASRQRIWEAGQASGQMRGHRQEVPVRGRTVLLVDDGVTTGTTLRVAADALMRRRPGALIIAVPVAEPSALDELRQVADEVICLSTPLQFAGIAAAYRRFDRVGEDRVARIVQCELPGV